jgi:hypothetical protein
MLLARSTAALQGALLAVRFSPDLVAPSGLIRLGEFPRVNPGLCFLGRFGPQIGNVQMRYLAQNILTSRHSTLGYAFLATSGRGLETSKMKCLWADMTGAKHIRNPGLSPPAPLGQIL